MPFYVLNAVFSLLAGISVIAGVFRLTSLPKSTGVFLYPDFLDKAFAFASKVGNAIEPVIISLLVLGLVYAAIVKQYYKEEGEERNLINSTKALNIKIALVVVAIVGVQVFDPSGVPQTEMNANQGGNNGGNQGGNNSPGVPQTGGNGTPQTGGTGTGQTGGFSLPTVSGTGQPTGTGTTQPTGTGYREPTGTTGSQPNGGGTPPPNGGGTPAPKP